MAGAAGLLNVIPAMQLLGHEFAWPTLVLWALAVSFLGVFFAVPLRRQFIEVDKLRFPTGTATAATILAMNSESGDAVAKARGADLVDDRCGRVHACLLLCAPTGKPAA